MHSTATVCALSSLRQIQRQSEQNFLTNHTLQFSSSSLSGRWKTHFVQIIGLTNVEQLKPLQLRSFSCWNVWPTPAWRNGNADGSTPWLYFFVYLLWGLGGWYGKKWQFVIFSSGIGAALTQDNCVCTQKLGGGDVSRRHFWCPRQCREPVCSALMVFMPAWLPLALDPDLYYPAGSCFITAELISAANFLFPVPPSAD